MKNQIKTSFPKENLKGKKLEELQLAITTLEKAVVEGFIMKRDFNTTVTKINKAIATQGNILYDKVESAWDKWLQKIEKDVTYSDINDDGEPYTNTLHLNQPILPSNLYSLAGLDQILKKRSELSTYTPIDWDAEIKMYNLKFDRNIKDIYKPVFDFIKKWEKVMELVKTVEPLAFTKKDKEKRDLINTHANSSDVKKLRKCLEKLTKDAHKDLIEAIKQSVEANIKNIDKELKRVGKNINNFKDIDYYRSDLYTYYKYDSGYGKDYDNKYVKVKNWKELIDRNATAFANSGLASYIEKNLVKLSAIIAKKKLKDIKARVSTNSGVFQSNMTFNFDDGSSFKVVNQIVFSYSTLGKPFAKFPTTFHDIIMSDGKKIKSPSELQMHKIFIG